MSTIIHREAVVGADGRIEINTPELRPGQRVNVTIEPEQEQKTEEQPREGLSMIDIIRQSPGQRLFKTEEEVDEYIRKERESWDF